MKYKTKEPNTTQQTFLADDTQSLLSNHLWDHDPAIHFYFYHYTTLTFIINSRWMDKINVYPAFYLFEYPVSLINVTF